MIALKIEQTIFQFFLSLIFSSHNFDGFDNFDGFNLKNLNIFNNFDFHALNNKQAWPLIFTFLIVALFDSTGTMLGLSHQMGQGKPEIQKINKALLAESIATTASSFLGATTAAAFVESASGFLV